MNNCDASDGNRLNRLSVATRQGRGLFSETRPANPYKHGTEVLWCNRHSGPGALFLFATSALKWHISRSSGEPKFWSVAVLYCQKFYKPSSIKVPEFLRVFLSRRYGSWPIQRAGGCSQKPTLPTLINMEPKCRGVTNTPVLELFFYLPLQR